MKNLDRPVQYDGELKFNALLEWLLSHVAPSSSRASDPRQKPVRPPQHSKVDATVAPEERQVKLEEPEGRQLAGLGKSLTETVASALRPGHGAEVGDDDSRVQNAHSADPAAGVEENSGTGYEMTGAPAPVPQPGVVHQEL